MTERARLPRLRERATPISVKYAMLLTIGIVATAYHLYYAYYFNLPIDKHVVAHFGLLSIAAAVTVFDPEFYKSGSILHKFDQAVLLPAEAIAAGYASWYLYTNYEALVYESIGIYSMQDTLVGLLVILVALDLSRRTFGWVITGVGLLAIVYGVLGPVFPGILSHGGVSFERIVNASTVEFTGVFGQILRVGSTYVVIFIIFAGFLETFGALGYFIQLGGKAGKFIKSGVPQTAVIASLGMASVNGSAAANSATTGAFTIPLMKDEGIESESAAAIESVASSGGQVMPPVMGAAAFLMADITGVPYFELILIALLPALLFYLSVAIAVHMLYMKEDVSREGSRATIEDRSAEEITEEPAEVEMDVSERVEEVSLGSSTQLDLSLLTEGRKSSPLLTVLRGTFLWVPLAVLIYTLAVLRYGPLLAGFWSTIAIVPTAFVQTMVFSDDRKRAAVEFVGNFVDGCRIGIENTAPISMALAVMGLFVGILNLTGLTQAIASGLVSLAGGTLVLLLIFAMVAAILFGLGMPTVAAYIVSVLLIAPALEQMGVQLVSAHMFVFYFAILSALTPPVAIACIITSKLADGNFWMVCKKSIAIGFPLFVLPYIFVVNGSLLYWSFETIVTFPAVLVGMVAVSLATINYLNGPFTVPVRIGLVLIGFAIFFSPALVGSTMTSLLIQIVLAGVVLGIFTWRLDGRISIRGAPQS